MDTSNKITETPDKFINSTYFIIPIWFDDFSIMTAKLEADTVNWKRNTLTMPYLLSYANQIAVSEDLFRQYTFLHPEQVHPETKRENILNIICKKPERENEIAKVEEFLDRFEIAEVLLSVFETGIGFVEFKVAYGDLPVDSIIDFSYVFKNMRYKDKYNKPFLDDIAMELLPAGLKIIPFFYTAGELKHDCLCYHMIKLRPEEVGEEAIRRRMYHLGRSYSSAFSFDPDHDAGDSSRFDFRYVPFDNDRWSGSQEALANINYERVTDGQNYFLRIFKYAHLIGDYHFLYLMILNQRFAAIKYIEQIIAFGSEDSDDLRKLNHRIVKLKTVYSLRIISSDMLYQNVYTRMYDIMDIDNLLNDLQDNEQQVELLQSEESERMGKRAGSLLGAISTLMVFSALIDAASYFDLFPNFPGSPRWISLIFVVALAVIVAFLTFYWHKIFRRRK